MNKEILASINIVQDEQTIKTVENLGIEIWNEHYMNIISKEQIDYMLNKFQSFSAIKSQINEGYIYYLLNYASNNVGYFSIQKNEKSLFLSKLYIKKDYRKLGIGRAALDFIKKEATALGLNNINLVVIKNNKNSITAYIKNGFTIDKEIITEIGNGFIMDDYVMSYKF